MAIYTNLVADQGTNFDARVQLQSADGNNIDLTGYTVSSFIKKSFNSSTSYDFNASIVNLTGVVGLSLSAAETAAMKPGRYVFDVVISTQSGTRTRVLEGQLEILAGVTP
jgi:hypothetical protein